MIARDWWIDRVAVGTCGLPSLLDRDHIELCFWGKLCTALKVIIGLRLRAWRRLISQTAARRFRFHKQHCRFRDDFVFANSMATISFSRTALRRFRFRDDFVFANSIATMSFSRDLCASLSRLPICSFHISNLQKFVSCLTFGFAERARWSIFDLRLVTKADFFNGELCA